MPSRLNTVRSNWRSCQSHQRIFPPLDLLILDRWVFDFHHRFVPVAIERQPQGTCMPKRNRWKQAAETGQRKRQIGVGPAETEVQDEVRDRDRPGGQAVVDVDRAQEIPWGSFVLEFAV